MPNKADMSSFVYVTYIRTTPERLWSALTSAEEMREYWFGMQIRSQWKQGARWELIFPDGRLADSGEIVEFDPPKRLVLKWLNEWKPELHAEGHGTCTIELEPVSDAVKLTICHLMDCADSQLIKAVSGGWPGIVSNLKSLLETGRIAFSRPAERRTA